MKLSAIALLLGLGMLSVSSLPQTKTLTPQREPP